MDEQRVDHSIQVSNNRFNVLHHDTQPENNETDDIPVLNQLNDIKHNDNNVTVRNNKSGKRKKKESRKNSKWTHDSTTDVQDRKVVSILGDSILKDVKGYELSSEENKVLVKSFSGAAVECMTHYIQPTMKLKPDVLILHCGANNLKYEKPPEELAEEIVKLAKDAASLSENTSIIVSGTVERNDTFKDIVKEVNKNLEKMCNKRNIGYLDHPNIKAGAHINRSKLHLNHKLTSLITKNLRIIFSD